MIVHPAQIIYQDGYAILWCKIEMGQKQENFPKVLWYRTPEQFGGYFSLQSDAFLAAVIQAAMRYGESIEVRGPVSPRLAYHLDEYQFVLNLRKPGILKTVKIEYDQISPQETTLRGVGSTFTGGVDSTYTLWKHLPANQPNRDFQITDLVFIRGFDILHSEENNYRRLYDKFEQQLAPSGINLIRLETNMLSFIHTHLKYAFFYGPLIVSAGLALQGGLMRYYVPSTWDYYNLKDHPHTGDALVDGFLSTESIDIIHHGSDRRRVEKAAQIANWELAQEVLWVCLEHKFEENTWNCSWCEKCVRTMIPLYALGVLDRFTTFEKPFTRDRDGLLWARKFSLLHDFVTEIFPFVKKHRPDFLPWLYLAAFLGYLRYTMVKFLPDIFKNMLRRYGYFITRNQAPDAYEDPAVTAVIQKRDEVLKSIFPNPSPWAE